MSDYMKGEVDRQHRHCLPTHPLHTNCTLTLDQVVVSWLAIPVLKYIAGAGVAGEQTGPLQFPVGIRNESLKYDGRHILGARIVGEFALEVLAELFVFVAGCIWGELFVTLV